MAKNLTKKIRISEYDLINNQFKITFELRKNGYISPLDVIYNQCRDIDLTRDAADTLNLLGFSDFQIERILNEIYDWIEHPRKRLGDLSYGYTMRTRLDLEKNAELDRRDKAEVERIAMKAPCLDWAISVTEELEAEDAVAVGADVQASSVNDSTVRIAAMEAAGFDEAPVAAKVPEGWAFDPYWRDESADPDVPTIDYVMGRMSDALGETAEKINCAQEAGMRTAIRAGLYRHDFERATTMKPIIDLAVDKAVSAIHTQARRFLTPMSYREHGFLRDFVREEIEKVVQGVL